MQDQTRLTDATAGDRQKLRGQAQIGGFRLLPRSPTPCYVHKRPTFQQMVMVQHCLSDICRPFAVFRELTWDLASYWSRALAEGFRVEIFREAFADAQALAIAQYDQDDAGDGADALRVAVLVPRYGPYNARVLVYAAA